MKHHIFIILRVTRINSFSDQSKDVWLYDTGHGKIETMGALTISSLLLVTGGGIAWHAAETLQAWRGCPLRLNCQDLSVEIYSAGYVVVGLGTTMIPTILWFVGLS